MNYQKAIIYLELEDNIDMKHIKKQYRKLALKYHPDKNPSSEAAIRFLEISESYNFLCEYFQSDNYHDHCDINTPYSELLKEFLQSIFVDVNISSNIYLIQILQRIIEKITNICEDKSIDFFRKINKQLLKKIYEILYIYRDVLSISDNFLEQIHEIIDEKIKNDFCVILNPTLEDLFEHNLYKLHHENLVFIIPLWQHELVYDISGTDFYVKCFPMLPDNVTIDKDNNIIIEIFSNITSIFKDVGINIEFANKLFHIEAKDIRLIKEQTICLKKSGIPTIYSNNIYEVDHKSNIFVDLFLTDILN
jgi:hypothetical protein